MAARPQTPSQATYNLKDQDIPYRYFPRSNLSRPSSFAGSTSYNYGSGALDPQIHTPRFKEEFDAASHRSSVVNDGPAVMQRSASTMSHVRSSDLTGGGTLKKKASLSKRGSLRRNGSRKSMRAGSVRSLSLGDREKYHTEGSDDVNSAFMLPIPANGNPTEVMANRFTGGLSRYVDLMDSG